MKNNVPESFHIAIKDTIKEIEKDTSKNLKNKTFKTVIVTILAAVILTVSAFACNEIYKKFFKETGKFSGEIQVNETVKTDSEFQIKLNFLPKEFELTEENKYNYKGRPALSFEIINPQLNNDQYKNIIKSEDKIYGEHSAKILTLNRNNMKLALVNFDDKGVVLRCFYNENIPQEEIDKILSNLELEKIKENNQDTPTLQPYEYKLELAKIIKQGEKYGSIKDSINGTEFTFKVTNAKILRTAETLDKDFIVDNFKQYINSDGTLKNHTKEIIEKGDGINTVDRVIDTVTVKRKIVAVTIEIENKTDKKGEFPVSLLSLFNKENNSYETEAMAITNQRPTDSQFYFVPVDCNSKKEITVYYLVDDESDLNDYYLFIPDNTTYTYCLMKFSIEK